MYASKVSLSIFCNINVGCVLEESNVVAPEMPKRLDSKNTWQHHVKSLRKEASERIELFLGTTSDLWSFPYEKLLMLTVVWLAFFAVQVLRGGKSSLISFLSQTSSS